MDKVKILFLSRLYYPHVGGVEKHIKSLSLNLIKKGHDITILSTKFDEELKEEEEMDGIRVIRFNQPEIKFIGLLYTWWWLLKHISLIKESDIVHIHDVFIWYWPFRVIYPKKKVYTTFHGRWGKYPITLSDKIQKKIGARFSEGVICIGNYIPENYGIHADIVTYGATEKVAAKSEKDDKLVFYVGRLDKDIALHTIFEVLKRLKGWKIMFCGEGELSYEANIYGKVLGFVDPAPYYKKAKYCFASGYLTIMEALSHRCLVFAAYDNPLQKDYYEMAPFRKYIICSINPNELYEKFIYYKNNPKSARKLTDAGYEWVKKQSWERLVEQYLELWKDHFTLIKKAA